MPRQSFSPKRLLKSFHCAGKGIWQVFRHENNMHIHLLASIVALLIGGLPPAIPYRMAICYTGDHPCLECRIVQLRHRIAHRPAYPRI